ncbi:MAG: basic amino acid ABC transporter substrate-binding protein [Firmicutes bacterium]|nr:basic amino acid ABC transporter substrate-binding protein [Bacillota bacterium]
MKKFKSIISATLAGVMIMSMIGCGQSAPTEPSSPSAGGETPAVEIKTAVDGKLTWATSADFPPYEFIENEQVVGIDAEVMEYVAGKLGLESAPENMDFSSVITAVSSGKTDIAASGITVNEDRKQSVDFSDPYVSTSQVVIVRFDSPIKTVEDLAGKTIGVQLNTTGDEYVTTNYTDATVERYGKGFEAIEALKQLKLDAVVIDGDTADKFIEADTSGDIVKLEGEPLTVEEYAFAVQKGNTALLDAINSALAEMKENGKLDEIIGKYKAADDSEKSDGTSETEAEAETATDAA